MIGYLRSNQYYISEEKKEKEEMKKGFLTTVFIGISCILLTWCLCQTADADPVISVAPMSVNMGNIPVGGTSASKTVTITNKGTSDLSLDSITITGINASEFSQTNRCLTIPAKGSCPVTVTFIPTVPFGKKDAVMSIVSNDLKKPTVNVKLSGQAPPPKISASPMSVNLGSVPVGSSSMEKTVTIKNTGVSDLVMDSITITGTNASEFSQTNSCLTIPAKGSCPVTVIFIPTAPFGKKDAIMSIVSNDPKKLTLLVKLSGQAPPPKITVSPASANFGSVTAGNTSLPKVFTVKNTGTSDLVVNSITLTGTNASEFNQTSDCTTVAKGVSCTIIVSLSPTSAGSKTALLNISSNDSKKSDIVVKLAGTGLQAPDNPPVDAIFNIAEYFPLGQGDTWTYREGDTELTTRTVSGTQKINDVNAVKVIDEDGDYQLWTNSNGIVWYKEYDADDIPGCGWEQLIFSPPIHASDPLVSVGSSYISNTTLAETDCTGKSSTTSFSYEFTIDGIEDVTVPAGTFSECLKITGIMTVNGTSQTTEQSIWLSKGVGQIKTISVDKVNGSIVEKWTEDLVSAIVGGVHYP
ncbi:MAG: ompB-2 [Nitrospirae bacterium]|nr:ompB-2 [Nitrospirota bacterium]